MRPLGVLLVLAALALPVASASPIGETGALVFRTIDETYATAAAAVGEATAPFAPPEEEQQAPEEETAPEEQHEEHAHSEDHAHASEPAPEPRRDDGLVGTIPAPVSRLVPIPVDDVVGALPRVDVGHLATVVADAAPVAPQQAPARAPAPQPAALETTAVDATPAGPSVGPDVVVAGVVATAGAAAAAQQGGAAHLWERIRRLGFLAVLYSRIAKERLLDHGSREALLDAIRAKPGLAVADLVTVTGIPRNTVTYHLRVLEREALVSSTRNGRNRLYFSPGSLPQRASGDALAALRHETTLAVARAIGASPGVDQKGICASLGLSPSLAHWHADRLVANGLVDKRREGRFVRYYPGAAYGIVEGRAA